MKPTNKNLAEFSGKGVTTIARWKKDNKVLYAAIKSEFMKMNKKDRKNS